MTTQAPPAPIESALPKVDTSVLARLVPVDESALGHLLRAVAGNTAPGPVAAFTNYI